jgi:hypothetical protein
VAKPKNWREVQAIRWHIYAEFKDLIEDFFETELDVRQDKLAHQKERLLDRLKKATEIYHA